MMKTTGRYALPALLFALLPCVHACSDENAPEAAAHAEKVAPQATPEAPDPDDDACAPVAGAAPVKIVLFQDKSRSAAVTRTVPLTENELVRLVALTCRGGGALAVGLISDDSNKPLMRLALPAPPAAPVLEAVPDNPLEAEDVDARNTERLAAYKKARAAWRDGADEPIAAFRDAAMALLQTPADAPRTDVVSAAIRAKRFLAEPMKGQRPNHTWAIFNTDGEDTMAHRQQPPDALHGQLLTVNGAGRTGKILPRYSPIEFEAISAAIDHIEHVESSTESRMPRQD